MFYLTHDITINRRIRLSGVKSVSVQRSIHNIQSTATITLPTSSVLVTGDIQQRVEVAEQIKRGDEIEIRLGYDGDNKLEFKGYVSRVNETTPLRVECLDYTYLFQNTNIKKSYKNTTLLQVMQDLVQGISGVSLDSEIPDIGIDNLILALDTGEEVTRALALERIKEKLGIAIYFRPDGTLYAGLHYTPNLGEVKHSLGVNTRDDGSELKYQQADETKIKLKAIYIDDAGKKTEVTVGDDDGGLRTVYFSEVSNVTELKTLAENRISQLRYDGYNGKFSAFMQPFCAPGYITEITDEQFPERAGKYYIDSVTVEFGESGGKRSIEITQKVS